MYSSSKLVNLLTTDSIVMMMMMMMMMSRFVERVLNSPRARCQSAEQVSLQMSSERRGGESCGSQGGWQTVPDNWTCDCETPHPQRGPCPWYGQ